MTREEEIKEAAVSFCRVVEAPNGFAFIPQSSFVVGALWADAHPHWISVEDEELPKEHQWFLGYSPVKSAMLVDVYNSNSNGLIEAHGITHWMPLPHPPISHDTVKLKDEEDIIKNITPVKQRNK